MPVDACDRDGKVKLATGKLLTIDNQIDTTTGTVKLKAEFANADAALFPNQFVNVRMLVETLNDATLVPIGGDPARRAGHVRLSSSRTTRRSRVAPVKLGPVEGETTVIDKRRRRPASVVVVDGADKLREGAKVELIDARTRRPPATPRARQGRRLAAQGRRGQGRRREPAAPGAATAQGAATAPPKDAKLTHCRAPRSSRDDRA